MAHAAYVPHNLPLDKIEPGLQDTAVYDPPSFAFSNGAHACEVEIDPETGVIRLVGYWAVDDVGTVINPMIVHGQVQGGIAQGAGQALLEHCAYDPDGQLLSGSFMDYALPRATDLPSLIGECDETEPCTHNPLGAKGCGEAGAIAAPPAIVGAALDALHPLGCARSRHAAHAASRSGAGFVKRRSRRVGTAPHGHGASKLYNMARCPRYRTSKRGQNRRRF